MLSSEEQKKSALEPRPEGQGLPRAMPVRSLAASM
jgi:hypothetical protein